jgi:hypothetical protein
MDMRLGEILVRGGHITHAQLCELVIEHQRSHRPVGYLAQEMFHVPARAVEDAWAAQYAHISTKVDPRMERLDPEALELISRRQAWQFGMIPLRNEHGRTIICTDQPHLARALRFAYRHIGPECEFVLSEPAHLGQVLSEHYPMDGAHELMHAGASNEQPTPLSRGPRGR